MRTCPGTSVTDSVEAFALAYLPLSFPESNTPPPAAAASTPTSTLPARRQTAVFRSRCGAPPGGEVLILNCTQSAGPLPVPPVCGGYRHTDTHTQARNPVSKELRIRRAGSFFEPVHTTLNSTEQTC